MTWTVYLPSTAGIEGACKIMNGKPWGKNVRWRPTRWWEHDNALKLGHLGQTGCTHKAVARDNTTWQDLRTGSKHSGSINHGITWGAKWLSLSTKRHCTVQFHSHRPIQIRGQNENSEVQMNVQKFEVVWLALPLRVRDIPGLFVCLFVCEGRFTLQRCISVSVPIYVEC
jgi:hypothetical protein